MITECIARDLIVHQAYDTDNDLYGEYDLLVRQTGDPFIAIKQGEAEILINMNTVPHLIKALKQISK